ncbi:MAG: CotH kinase family protein [Lewinellaceae bacterium]|nr:CotH kinase family protein [Lewinellaceae bacterium]
MNKIIIGILVHFCVGYNFAQSSLIINEYMSSNANTITDFENEYSDWIELFNNQNTEILLSNYSLSDDLEYPDKWIFPDVEIPANGYLLIWASGKNTVTTSGEIHCNFKIKSTGESLFLFSPSRELLDESPSIQLAPDISIGRIPSDLINWYYFNVPTPESENNTNHFSDRAKVPGLSQEGGIYTTSVTITLNPNHPDDQLRYTIDGSSPNESSPLYSSPITISTNTVLRVKAYRQDALPSRITTNSYLFDNDLNLRVISLATDPDNLFGSNGIYQNYNSGEERPIHLEYYELDQSLGFKIDLGVKIHSPSSLQQKSLRLYARESYGTKIINYKIFEDKDIDSFKTLVLRNGGNDGAQSQKTHIRDAFTHRVYQLQDIEYGIAAYQPVHVYINGNYWGVYNLRERQDEHYIESNFGYAKDEVDFLEYDYAEPGRMKTVCGDWNDWNALNAYVVEKDLSVSQNYQVVEDWIDVDNYIDYQIFEIFIGNQDWINNNTKFWRPKTPSGKWKWVLWDTDYALGTQKNYPVGHPDFDFMHMVTSWGGWGNDDWTWMFRNIVENEDFKRQFITRFLDLLNTTFQPEYTLYQFDYLASSIESDMQKQFSRWGSSVSQWNTDLDHTRNFLEQRQYYNRVHIASEFDLNPTLHDIELNVSDTQAGNIKINTIIIDENTLGWQKRPYPWNGKYYEGFEINVTAIAKPGFQFLYWEGDINSDDPSLTLALTEDIMLQAVFGPDESTQLPSLYINEIMASNNSLYPDDSGAFEDWIEIYNGGDTPVNLAELYLTDDLDDPLKWEIPSSEPDKTNLLPGEYITFFADDDPEQGVLHLNFKLKAQGEVVGLFYKNQTDEISEIDAIEFSLLSQNTSYGRLPDGGLDWVVFQIPTPNATNKMISTGNSEAQIITTTFKVFPNPVSTILNINIEENTSVADTYLLNIFDELGKLVNTHKLNNKGVFQIDVSNWARGIYFAKISHPLMDSLIHKIIVY